MPPTSPCTAQDQILCCQPGRTALRGLMPEIPPGPTHFATGPGLLISQGGGGFGDDDSFEAFAECGDVEVDEQSDFVAGEP